MRRLARTLRSAFGSEEEAPRVQHAPSGAGAAPPAAPVGSHREHWMPDESVSACYDCEQLFSLFLRRHHCRLCGRVFCNRCAEQRPITAQAPAADAGAHETQLVRVCNYCYRQRQMEQAAAASDVARLTSAPAARAGATDEAGEQQSAQKADCHDPFPASAGPCLCFPRPQVEHCRRGPCLCRLAFLARPRGW